MPHIAPAIIPNKTSYKNLIENEKSPARSENNTYAKIMYIKPNIIPFLMPCFFDEVAIIQPIKIETILMTILTGKIQPYPISKILSKNANSKMRIRDAISEIHKAFTYNNICGFSFAVSKLLDITKPLSFLFIL